MPKKIFENQEWHFALLALLLVLVTAAMNRFPLFSQGEFWGIAAGSWLWMGIVAAILHQVYVMIIWRIQLETQWLTINFPRLGYIAYLADYAILLVARFAALFFLAIANQDSMAVSVFSRWSVTFIIAGPFLWLLYSLIRFYGFKRLAGADHFDPAYRDKPYIKEGIFKYTVNSIYTIGPLGFYVPGILFASPAALLLAVFNTIYIWVHYYCTELPDAKRINKPNNS